MAHAALAGAEVALPEPPGPEAAAAGPAGDDFPHVVTLCNAKSQGLTEQAFTQPAFMFPGIQVLAGWANFKVLSRLFPPQGATVSNSSANTISRKDAHLPDAAIPSGSPARPSHFLWSGGSAWSEICRALLPCLYGHTFEAVAGVSRRACRSNNRLLRPCCRLVSGTFAPSRF